MFTNKMSIYKHIQTYLLLTELQLKTRSVETSCIIIKFVAYFTLL